MIIELSFVGIALVGLFAYLLKLRELQNTQNPTSQVPKCHMPIEKTSEGYTLKCPHGCQNAGTTKCPLEAKE